MFNNLIDYTPLLISGAFLTFELGVVSFALAILLGAMGAMAKIHPTSRSLVIPYYLANFYTLIVRGIPDLVMMLLIYYGGQRLLNQISESMGMTDTIQISPFLAGSLTLGFIFGAYMSEVFRGAFMSIPRGQLEAAKALGLHPLRILVRIIVPQLLRYAVAGINNVWQVLLKSTALVSVIGLEDLVGLADKAGKTVREPFIFMVAVIVGYLVLTAISNSLFMKCENMSMRGIKK